MAVLLRLTYVSSEYVMEHGLRADTLLSKRGGCV